MGRTWAAEVARQAKGLGIVVAAVAVGATAGGVMSANAAGDAASHHRGASGADHRATPHATDSPGAQGVHGQCVSKVARDHEAVGGPHHNHGGAVSAAAHSCPH